MVELEGWDDQFERLLAEEEAIEILGPEADSEVLQRLAKKFLEFNRRLYLERQLNAEHSRPAYPGEFGSSRLIKVLRNIFRRCNEEARIEK